MADLRTRQRELARQTIVDACAELVTERRHLDFSMKEVAERAGVALRTVYNHFDAREDLLDALSEVMEERTQVLGSPNARSLETRDQLLLAVRASSDVFEQLGGISEAMAQLPLAEVGRNVERMERTKMITDFIASEMPSAPAEEAQLIGVVLRHLLSHRSWFWLTREYGLDTADFVRVVNWALDTLIDAAESGDLPNPKEQ